MHKIIRGKVCGKSFRTLKHCSLQFLHIFRLKTSPIILFGRSLGGAVSIYLANKFPDRVAGVIVENTFLSVSSMVDILMPFLNPIKSYVLNIKWNSDQAIPFLKQPILFISG
jgi:hypothetical protein